MRWEVKPLLSYPILRAQFLLWIVATIIIFGDYEGSHENDRWALTINKKGTPDASVAQAINVTQVREFTRAFHIVNGQLVLDDSTFVQVLSMDDDSLVFKDLKTGKRDRFYRSAE